MELEDGGRIDVDRPADPLVATRPSTQLKDESTLTLATEPPLGYHRLRARWPGGEATTALIVTPAFLGLPGPARRRSRLGTGHPALQRPLARVVGHRRPRGPARLSSPGPGPTSAPTSCWSTRSRRPSRVAPMEPSPYLPSSRAFVNPIYLRVDDDPRVRRPPARGPERRSRRWRATYTASSTTSTRSTGTPHGQRRRRHCVWCTPYPEARSENGTTAATSSGRAPSLRDFATWCALSELHGPDWHEWPEELQAPGSRAGRGLSRQPPGRRGLLQLAPVGPRRAARRRADVPLSTPACGSA